MVFTGKAVYDSGVFDDIADDVEEMVSMISPFETPVLDRLPQAERAATNVLHEWMEDKLGPNSVVSSTAVGSTTASSSVTVHDGAGAAITGALQVGMVLVFPSGEYAQVTGLSGNDVTFSRAQASTAATSYAAGATIEVLCDAALEGAEVGDDLSLPRARRTNYCQIFKKDLIISGTVNAVKMLGGISSEYEYQKGQRLKEFLRDVEKAVIRGRSFGNTLGSSTAYRSFNGILAQLTTNVSSVGSLTQTSLDAAIKSAWQRGGFRNGQGLILADSNFKGHIDQLNNSRLQVIQPDSAFRQQVSLYENTYGVFETMLCRWMPANSAAIISPERIQVVPLTGRSPQVIPVARVGDSERAMLLAELTVALKNEDGMAKISNGVLA